MELKRKRAVRSLTLFLVLSMVLSLLPMVKISAFTIPYHYYAISKCGDQEYSDKFTLSNSAKITEENQPPSNGGLPSCTKIFLGWYEVTTDDIAKQVREKVDNGEMYQEDIDFTKDIAGKPTEFPVEAEKNKDGKYIVVGEGSLRMKLQNKVFVAVWANKVTFILDCSDKKEETKVVVDGGTVESPFPADACGKDCTITWHKQIPVAEDEFELEEQAFDFNTPIKENITLVAKVSCPEPEPEPQPTDPPTEESEPQFELWIPKDRAKYTVPEETTIPYVSTPRVEAKVDAVKQEVEEPQVAVLPVTGESVAPLYLGFTSLFLALTLLLIRKRQV